MSRRRRGARGKAVVLSKDDSGRDGEVDPASPQAPPSTRVELVGTGNAKGIPMADCGCAICREAAFNLERRRNAPCAVFSCEGEAVVIDAGYAEIHRSALRYRINGVVLSHFHRGHTDGLSNIAKAAPNRLKVLCPPDQGALPLLQQLEQRLEFRVAHPGVGDTMGSARVTPLLLNHGSITYGYAIELGGVRLAYLCDTCGLPPQTEKWLAAWRPDVLLIDCNDLPGQGRGDHNCPQQAFAIHERCGARRSYLMHVSCAVDSWLAKNPYEIPSGVTAAHDGMVLEAGVLRNPPAPE